MYFDKTQQHQLWYTFTMYVRTTMEIMEISACTLLCYPYIFNVPLYTHVINMYVQNTLLY